MSDQYEFNFMQELEFGIPYDNGKGGALSPTGHAGIIDDWDLLMPPIPKRPFDVLNETMNFLLLNMIYQAEFPIQPQFKITYKVIDESSGSVMVEDLSQSSLV